MMIVISEINKERERERVCVYVCVMGKSGRCCPKEGVNRGAWSAIEDKLLTSYIEAHGEGKWTHLPKRAGI